MKTGYSRFDRWLGVRVSEFEARHYSRWSNWKQWLFVSTLLIGLMFGTIWMYALLNSGDGDCLRSVGGGRCAEDPR